MLPHPRRSTARQARPATTPRRDEPAEGTVDEADERMLMMPPSGADYLPAQYAMSTLASRDRICSALETQRRSSTLTFATYTCRAASRSTYHINRAGLFSMNARVPSR